MKGIYTFLILMFLSISAAYAQEGPIVPCVGCDSLTQAPFPETGLWFNPEQTPGSGLNFEIQNGVLAGFFYGYATDGKPEWQLVSGALVPSEVEGVLWELETTLTRADGGSCIGCEFNPPQITEGETIRLEFMQRNYMRISIGGVFDQFFVPFTYGSPAVAYFPGKTPYLFPSFDLDEFIFILRPQESTVYWSSFLATANPETVSLEDGKKVVIYKFTDLLAPLVTPAPPPRVIVRCKIEALDVACELELVWEEKIFKLPIGNFGGNRLFAEAVDGATIEGIRLDYD